MSMKAQIEHRLTNGLFKDDQEARRLGKKLSRLYRKLPITGIKPCNFKHQRRSERNKTAPVDLTVEEVLNPSISIDTHQNP